MRLFKKLKSLNGGSKKKILNLPILSLSRTLSILSLNILDFSIIDNLIKFSFKTSNTLLFCSIKVTFFAYLERASIPKDPIPEYKSKMLEFSILVFIKFECIKILKIFSFTES